MKKIVLLTAVATAAFGFAIQSQAQNIVWGAAQTMTGDTDVLNTGTFFDAVTFYSSPVTVNGVTFNNFTGAGDVNGNHTDGIIDITNGDGTGAFGAAFSKTSPSSLAYSNLVNTGAFGESTGKVTISGLTIGDTYDVESWSYYTGDPKTATTTYSGATPVALLTGTGQFAIGTFTATSTSESYTYSATGGNHNFINAVSVFDTVPEPGTYAMLVGGLGMLLAGQGLRRRRGISAH